MYSPNFTSSVLGAGLCDRNLIELVEANNYHHMYVTLCVHNITFLITIFAKIFEKLLVSVFSAFELTRLPTYLTALKDFDSGLPFEHGTVKVT